MSLFTKFLCQLTRIPEHILMPFFSGEKRTSHRAAGVGIGQYDNRAFPALVTGTLYLYALVYAAVDYNSAIHGSLILFLFRRFLNLRP